jgi:hypothetical protein
MEITDFSHLYELFVRLAFNTVVLLVLVRWLYYGNSRRKDYLFTFFMLGSIIFLMCFILENVKLQMGFAFGLFAIFGIMRYRTNPMPIKEMTYLFVVISISVVNALSADNVGYLEMAVANLFLIAVCFGFEKIWMLKHESSRQIVYEKIENIRPEMRPALIKDLELRTGLKISNVEIGKLDFLKDIAHIVIFYDSTSTRERFAEQKSIKSDEDDD